MEDNEVCVLRVAGNILDVAQGRVDITLLPVDLKNFRFALGSASFSDFMKYGEALVIDSQPYVSWMEGNEELIDCKKEINTSFLIGIDPQQKPSKLLYYKSTSSIKLDEFYQHLVNEFKTSFAVIGLGLFSQLDSTYLNQLPIRGVTASWKDVPSEKEAFSCFFGVVMPEMLRERFLQKNLDRTCGPALSHTHGGILGSAFKEFPKNLDEFYNALKDLPINHVRHFLPDSQLKEGVFAFFPLEKITDV